MEYKGYSLFDDIKDRDLRIRNMTAVMWNIYEHNSKKGRTSANGMVDLVGYLRKIPKDMQVEVINTLFPLLKEAKHAA